VICRYANVEVRVGPDDPTSSLPANTAITANTPCGPGQSYTSYQRYEYECDVDDVKQDKPNKTPKISVLFCSYITVQILPSSFYEYVLEIDEVEIYEENLLPQSTTESWIGMSNDQFSTCADAGCDNQLTMIGGSSFNLGSYMATNYGAESLKAARSEGYVTASRRHELSKFFS